MIAALYVQAAGCYANLPGVDLWPISRDARTYPGPWPVVAHPDCKRWGRFWHGSTRKPHQFKMGDDDGQFAAALGSARQWGGVIEHPKDSHAWDKKFFDLTKPPRDGGWVEADNFGGWTCCVEQGKYGHLANKPTWLLAYKIVRPELRWGRGAQRIHPRALELHGYEKARRVGMMAMCGGKTKTEDREATTPEFRDALLEMARSVR